MPAGDRPGWRQLVDQVEAIIVRTLSPLLVLVDIEQIFNRETNDCLWMHIRILLGGIRRWVFLPGLLFLIPTLVWIKGGGALEVCFNTIAVLFLCEIGTTDHPRARAATCSCPVCCRGAMLVYPALVQPIVYVRFCEHFRKSD